MLVVVEDRDVESRSLSRCSISKQRGAEMSSRLMPPKLGASRTTVSTISSVSVVSRQIGTASTPPNCLNSTALPSITGIAAAGPMSPRPEHRGAVGDDGDGVGDPGVVVDEVGLRGDRLADAGDAGRVGEREVVAVLERHGASDLHLAAHVQGEDRVDRARVVGGCRASDGFRRSRVRGALFGRARRVECRNGTTARGSPVPVSLAQVGQRPRQRRVRPRTEHDRTARRRRGSRPTVHESTPSARVVPLDPPAVRAPGVRRA